MNNISLSYYLNNLIEVLKFNIKFWAINAIELQLLLISTLTVQKIIIYFIQKLIQGLSDTLNRDYSVITIYKTITVYKA